MKVFQTLLVVFLSFLLVSCITKYKLGQEFFSDSVNDILVGMTTKDDIIRNFGEPYKTGLINGNEIYIYSYQEFVFKQNDVVEKNGNTLVIEFDENNIVKNYYFNVPGKEPVIIGVLIHAREKQKQAEQNAAMQNQMMMPMPSGPF